MVLKRLFVSQGISIVSLALASACAMAPEHAKYTAVPDKAPASVVEPPSTAAPIVSNQNEVSNDGLKVVFDDPKPMLKPEIKSETKVGTVASPLPTPVVATAAELKQPATPKSDQVDPETSLHWLQHGNLRFVKHTLRDDGQGSVDRTRLSEAQHPHAVILACSDSRVPPEIIFDQKLGEVLVVRTAGEAIDHASLASIEDAVERLGTRLILVLGHESCDMVQAAVKTADQKTLSPAMAATLESIKTRFAQAGFDKSRDVASTVDMNKAAEANATGAAHDLLNQSEILKRLVVSGQVQIHSALYHMKTGSVTFY